MKAKNQGASVTKLHGKIWLVLFYVVGFFLGLFAANGIANILADFFYRTFIQNFDFYSLLGFDQPFSFETESALGGLPLGYTVAITLLMLLFIGLALIPYAFLRRFVSRNSSDASRLRPSFKIGLIVTTSISVLSFFVVVASLVLLSFSLGISLGEAYDLTIITRLIGIWIGFLFLSFCLTLVGDGLGNYVNRKLRVLVWSFVGFYFAFVIVFEALARFSV